MGFIEIKQEMIDKRIFKQPDSFFNWAKKNFQTVKDKDLGAKGFAFCLLDKIAAEVENKDEIFREIIAYAETLGIKPWPNIVSLRPQASICLAEFIEKE